MSKQPKPVVITVDTRPKVKRPVPPQLVGKGFQKGDPRINRAGRTPVFNIVRSLAQKIAQEPITITKKHNKGVGKLEPITMTILEAILRDWALSKDSDKQKAFVAYAYGAPPIIQRNENFDINKFIDKFSDEDLIRIREGESPIDILFEKLERPQDVKELEEQPLETLPA